EPRRPDLLRRRGGRRGRARNRGARRPRDPRSLPGRGPGPRHPGDRPAGGGRRRRAQHPLHPGGRPVTRVPYLSSRLQGFGTTVFAEMSALAVATGSVNLGQGFPDYPGPHEVLDVARAAIGTGHDQYPPGPGIPELRQAIAEHVQRFRGHAYDPDTEVLVTAGATEALAAAFL